MATALGVRAKLGLFPVGGGALRGAGDGWGTGDDLSATDNTDLDAPAGCFVALGAVIVFGVPAVGLRTVDFADGIRCAFGAILLQAGTDDILAAADHTVIDFSQVPGVTGDLVLSFPCLLALGPACGTVAGAGAAGEGNPASLAGSGAQGGGSGGGKAVITLRLFGAICSSWGGAQMDLLCTDPPYNVDYQGTAGKIKKDNMEDTAFRRFLTDAFSNAAMVMKPGAPFYIWHADSEGYNFRGACRDAMLRVRQCLIWVKNSLVMGRQDFQWKHEPCLYGESEIEEEVHEPCLYGRTEGKKHYFFKNRRQTTVLNFDKPVKSAEHPTMKPIKLFDYQMQCSSKPGENVLDLFAGSGTTIMAAEQNGRHAFCMEYDPKYADVIVDRWEKFTGKKAVLLHDD